MKNLWNEVESTAGEGELEPLIYLTRLIGQDEALGVYGGGTASVKLTAKNLLGEEEEILFVNHGGSGALNSTDAHYPPGVLYAPGVLYPPLPHQLQAGDFTPLHCKPLARLVDLETLSPALLENELTCQRTRAAAPVPPAEALLHAALPYRYILLTQPDAILAIASTPGGPGRLRQLYGEALLVIPYAPSGLALAKACRAALRGEDSIKLTGIFVLHQGLVTFGETARQAYERLVDQVTRTEGYLESQGAWHLGVTPGVTDEAYPSPDRAVRQELAALRQAVSALAGRPLILSVQSDAAILDFCRRQDLAALVEAGPGTARQVPLNGRLPMVGKDVEAYRAACERILGEAEAQLPAPGSDPTPRIILDPQLGLGALGRTAGEAALARRIFRHMMDVMLRAAALKAYRPMPPKELLTLASSASGEIDEAVSASEAIFAGEIALVTGGASGIGKACVESLLRRGAAVATMDINPAVEAQFDRPDYLGLVCDLTDEQAVLRSFERLGRAFGGLDMLVLNAGIFPAGCRIEDLTLAEWQRVMRINLDSNLVVLREAHALLKHSPRGGRVLVNASKNVRAPGAGAAAYSSSKAAVTQLARVAALEWGKDRIRVNQIHPDAIFDTGIWTEEVLKARAAHYGMTVQQYKTRNVLGVELNSQYVGELVAEMLGPRFEKITGAQIPVDGGSDRVI